MTETTLSPLAQRSAAAVPANELQHFLDTFLYTEEAVLVDEITALDHSQAQIEAILDSMRPLPFALCQRVSRNHPGHVSGAELLMVTGALGCLHAWFFHGVRWDQGWAGFGNRVHRADFKRLARRGPPISLLSRETRTRVGPSRVVLRYDFEFRQEGELVYVSDQSAMFVRERALD
jgi:hypothetical protein